MAIASGGNSPVSRLSRETVQDQYMPLVLNYIIIRHSKWTIAMLQELLSEVDRTRYHGLELENVDQNKDCSGGSPCTQHGLG